MKLQVPGKNLKEDGKNHNGWLPVDRALDDLIEKIAEWEIWVGDEEFWASEEGRELADRTLSRIVLRLAKAYYLPSRDEVTREK